MSVHCFLPTIIIHFYLFISIMSATFPYLYYVDLLTSVVKSNYTHVGG